MAELIERDEVGEALSAAGAQLTNAVMVGAQQVAAQRARAAEEKAGQAERQAAVEATVAAVQARLAAPMSTEVGSDVRGRDAAWDTPQARARRRARLEADHPSDRVIQAAMLTDAAQAADPAVMIRTAREHAPTRSGVAVTTGRQLASVGR